MTKALLQLVSAAIFCIVAVHVFAAPADEVAATIPERARAFSEGNLEGYVEAFADNAVVTTAVQGFRLEGKQAIRQYFSEAFQNYPKRKFSARQAASRSYNDDTVIQNVYGILTMTDEQGVTKSMPIRLSILWAKISGRWRVVQQHGSVAPGME